MGVDVGVGLDSPEVSSVATSDSPLLSSDSSAGAVGVGWDWSLSGVLSRLMANAPPSGTSSSVGVGCSESSTGSVSVSSASTVSAESLDGLGIGSAVTVGVDGATTVATSSAFAGDTPTEPNAVSARAKTVIRVTADEPDAPRPLGGETLGSRE